MVKGVNKTVIEINDTGSKYFDRIVFYVNPDYSFISQNKLEGRAIDYVSEGFDCGNYKSAKRAKKIKKLWAAIAILAAAALVSAAFIFLL